MFFKTFFRCIFRCVLSLSIYIYIAYIAFSLCAMFFSCILLHVLSWHFFVVCFYMLFACILHAFHMLLPVFFLLFFYMLRHAFNFKCSLHLMWQKVHAEDTCGHVARHVLHFVPGEEAIKGMVAVQAGRGTQLALFFGAGTQQCLDHV